MDNLVRTIQVMSSQFNNANNTTNTNGFTGRHKIHDDPRYGRFNRRFCKLEFPKFDGEDVDGWIYKVEHFFLIDETPEATNTNCSDTFGRQGTTMAPRFADSFIENAMEELISIAQVGELKEYFDQFDALLNKVTITEAYAICIFIHGLKPEIGGVLRMFKPQTLKEAYSLARIQNSTLTKKPLHGSSVSSRFANSKPYAATNKISTPFNASKLPLLTTPTVSTKKFTPGHKCPNKQVFVIEVENTEEEQINEVIDEEVIWMVGTKRLHIVVDSGSTHNFLDETITLKMKCPFKEVAAMKVTIADGKGNNKFQHETQVKEVPFNSSIVELLTKFEDVFAELKGLPPSRPCDHRIVLKDNSITINQRANRYPVFQKDIIEKLTEEMLQSGIIRESCCSFASHVALVKKKDGSWRFCVDYRKLNEATVKNRYPIPLIEELLDELGRATVFSKLDLRFSYHQIRMHTEDIDKTAFQTHQGLFDPDMASHLLDLREVLSIMRQNKLMAKRSKCTFGGSQVEYLGHLISQGVSTDAKKIEAVVQWPIPQNLKQLRGFLGLAGYYRRFIQSFISIAKPLTNLLKKDSFLWSEAAQVAFETLKQALSFAPVLALPDFTKPFVVETDASSKGLGVVLMQDHHPIAYISKALSTKQLMLSVYEKELLAILMAIKQWHHYLSLNHFVIKTDQRSLKHLMDQTITTPLQQSWLAKMQGYSHEIVYKNGVDNVAADALSRISGSALFQLTLSSIQPLLLERVQLSCVQDPNLNNIKVSLQQGQQDKHFSWDGQLSRRKNRVCVGNDSQLRTDIMTFCHSSPTGGHSGIYPTIQRVKSLFYWKGLSKHIRFFVKNCDVCQRSKYETVASPGLLEPLPVPRSLFTDITMDFITGLPMSQNKDTIFVAMHWLTKFAPFMALKYPYTAKQVAQVSMDNIFKMHGCPSSIVSDQDPIFLSRFWKKLMHLQGITLNMSSAYHPQSDGQTEVLNRCLETYLHCMTLGVPQSWCKWLSMAQYWYNTT
ncbi:hypothetical protein E3N88_16448 [Mikania micrantha]|uniref:Integrase catalytic domain-containing protein n=1 Tax=Mikania micrantha TaxID=192012 RepID=A0A5N6NZP4_9ASTR|nr:hypothetical protein E3N88_16448 [Mikania micrantha]